ncbi:MAG: aminotransferase class V-fold PLP-dependent enzyme [Gammaproteobacteria bacterium]|nr:aminotransferase class V-fold PLP-dependent enzyme [Gammaproteobacteria bacterium]
MTDNYFKLDDSLAYLNHAAVSPWPIQTARAVERFAMENARYGAANYPEWLKTEEHLRELIAWLINAPSSKDISILKNTSEALSVIAYGIVWNPGDNLVCFEQEFPSNRIVWESLSRLGVETRLVDLAGSADPETDLINTCDDRTRLISVSSVQYAAGQRMMLDKIGEFCRNRDVLFCVDAIQSLGAIPFDVQQVGADFVVADGHKWMMGPEGAALFYSRREIRGALQLNQFGWRMVADPGNYDEDGWCPSDSGTRFECGSPNMLGIHGLEASLRLVREIGVEKIFESIRENTDILIALIEAAPERVTLISDKTEHRRSGIVTFRVEGTDQKALYRRLMAKGVICAYRGGGIRFSPHFHTRPEDLEKAWSTLGDLL